jgi:Spy/CpxP family protein refolding chaperone
MLEQSTTYAPHGRRSTALSSTRFFGLAALAAVLALPLGASAQTPLPGAVQPGVPGAPGAGGTHRHGGRHGGMMRMLRTLNLTAAQNQQIQTIMQQSRNQNQNVTDPATRRANRQRTHQQIEAVLTPAQRTQLQQEMKQQRQRHRDQGAGMPGMPGPVPTPVH